MSNLYLPKAQTIGSYAFSYCTNLATIDFQEAITIGTYTFSSTDLTGTLYLPKAQTIGYAAFYDLTKLTTVNLPEAITIVDYAFSGCSGLTTVKFGSQITSWGDNVFRDVTTSNIVLYLGTDELANASGKVWRTLTWNEILPYTP